MRDIDIKYPSSVICLLCENRPTRASSTLLLAVAPPAHKSPRSPYDDTFELQVPRRNDNAPVGPHRRKAAYNKWDGLIHWLFLSVDCIPRAYLPEL